MKVHNLICLHDTQVYYPRSYHRVKGKMLVIKISSRKTIRPVVSNQLLLYLLEINNMKLIYIILYTYIEFLL